MAKKKDNTLIYIGAAAILYFIFMRKKASATTNKKRGQIIVEDSEHVEFLPKNQMRRIQKNVNELNIDPIIDKNDYFKQQYQQSLNACSY